MKLNRLRIVNFRCFKDVTIEVGAMHALVGANNAGKSTILHALDFLFNPSASKITEEAFWHRDSSSEIRVEATFNELTQTEVQALEGYLKPDSSFHLARIAAVKATDDDVDDDGKIKIGQQFNRPTPIKEWLVESKINAKAITEWLKTPASLIIQGQSFSDAVGAKPTVDKWKITADEFSKNILKLEDFQEKWNDNPKGFPNVLKANLPHFELIPAVRDAADEAKVLKTNPFGRLIHEIVNKLDESLRSHINEQLKQTTRRLNREGKEERLSSIKDVEMKMQSFLSEVMPADLEIEFQTPTIETLLTTPKIYIDDGFRGSLDGKGHGLQRAVIFSILRSYAELVTKKNTSEHRTLILGVEEPELYMHPTAQRTIRRVFREIADAGDQVIFTTHSPLLVDVAYFDEIIRVEPNES